jgi:hypothetical protein
MHLSSGASSIPACTVPPHAPRQPRSRSLPPCYRPAKSSLTPRFISGSRPMVGHRLDKSWPRDVAGVRLPELRCHRAAIPIGAVRIAAWEGMAVGRATLAYFLSVEGRCKPSPERQGHRCRWHAVSANPVHVPELGDSGSTCLHGGARLGKAPSASSRKSARKPRRGSGSRPRSSCSRPSTHVHIPYCGGCSSSRRTCTAGWRGSKRAAQAADSSRRGELPFDWREPGASESEDVAVGGVFRAASAYLKQALLR